MKKIALCFTLILSTSICAFDWHKYTPIGAALTTGSVVTAAAMKTYNWYRRDKSQSKDLIAESKKCRLLYEHRYQNSAATIRQAIRTPGGLEAIVNKIRQLPSEQRNDLLKFIREVETHIDSMHSFVPKKNDQELEQLRTEKKELGMLAQQLSPIKPYLQHTKTVIDLEIIVATLIRKNECSASNTSHKVQDAMDSFQNTLHAEVRKASYDLSQYPTLRQKIADFTTQLKNLKTRLVAKETEEEKQCLIKNVDQRLNQTYATELSMQVNEATVNTIIRKKHMEYKWNFPYVSYLERLNNDIRSLEYDINEHDYLAQFKPTLARLKQFKVLMYDHSTFSQNYKMDLAKYEQHRLEQQRIQAYEERTRLEEKARQESLDLDRRKTKAAEEQVRLERERIDAEHNRERAERDRARKEEERRAAEERHARALEEQNRLERERQQRQPSTAPDVNYMRQQVGQIPNASAPPA